MHSASHSGGIRVDAICNRADPRRRRGVHIEVELVLPADQLLFLTAFQGLQRPAVAGGAEVLVSRDSRREPCTT